MLGWIRAVEERDELETNGAYMCLPIEDYEANYLTEEKKALLTRFILRYPGLSRDGVRGVDLTDILNIDLNKVSYKEEQGGEDVGDSKKHKSKEY